MRLPSKGGTWVFRVMRLESPPLLRRLHSAKVVERHFTLDRTMKGGDHAASLEPNGLNKVVKYIRTVESAMGLS